LQETCWFCPVSVAPRPDVVMSDALFARIAGDLAGLREGLEAVFLQSYNEPTVERRFVDHCRALMAAGLPVAVLTNGSGLTPAKIDALAAAGRLRYLAINLSTLDRARYARDRGHDHLRRVRGRGARHPQQPARHRRDRQQFREARHGILLSVSHRVVRSSVTSAQVTASPGRLAHGWHGWRPR
jgi:hypothetical protein